MKAPIVTRKNELFGLVFAVGMSISTLAAALPAIDQCQYNPADLANTTTATATIDRLRNGGCLDKLRQTEKCLAKAAQLAGDVNSMLTKFNKRSPDTPLVVDAIVRGAVASSNVDLNIWRNFDALQNDYNASLDAIEHLVEQYAKPSPTAMGIQAQISELDRGIFAAADSLTRLATREAALLAVIESSKQNLAALQTQAEATMTELASPTCQYAGTAAMVTKARLAVASLVSDVEFALQHVLQAKEARQGLLNYAYVALRSALEQAYRDLELQHTTELQAKIDVVLDLNRISSRFEAWFNYISFDQERDLVETVYQLYDESRRLWAADLVIEKAFQLQVSMVAKSNPDLAAPYLARINSVIQNTTDRLAQLEQRGWSGYLSKQRAMATRLLTQPDKLPDNCAAQLQIYLGASASVGDIDYYRPLEKHWRDTVQSCMTRRQS